MGGTGGSQSPASRTPFSRLPPFIVFLPLSRKSRCLTPYSDSIRSALALSKIKNCVVKNCVVIPTLRRTSTLALLRQRLYRDNNNLTFILRKIHVNMIKCAEAPFLLQYIRVAHKPITTLQRQGQRQTGGQTGSSIQDQMLRLLGFLHW